MFFFKRTYQHLALFTYHTYTSINVCMGSLTRSASRCNKGLEILMTACVEDNFLIVMRVHRGPQHADHCLDQVKPQLYCQICEEQCFLPGGLTPIGKNKLCAKISRVMRLNSEGKKFYGTKDTLYLLILQTKLGSNLKNFYNGLLHLECYFWNSVVRE